MTKPQTARQPVGGAREQRALNRRRTRCFGGRVSLMAMTLLALMAASATSASASEYECFGTTACQIAPAQQPLVKKTPGNLFLTPTSTTYVIYWDPASAPAAYPEGYVSGITRFFKDLAHDSGGDQNFYSVLTQYGVQYQTHYGKSLTVKDPYPSSPRCQELSGNPSCVMQSQVEDEIFALVKQKKLPPEFESLQEANSGSGLRNAYFLVLPPGVSACQGGTFDPICTSGPNTACAWHGLVEPTNEEFEGSTPFLRAEELAIEPYVAGEKGCDLGQHPNGVSDSVLGNMTHEFAEMVTDPSAEQGWTNSLVGRPEEVADICADGYWASGNEEFHSKMLLGAPLGTASNGALYNQVINKHHYYLPQLYSNEERGCRQRRALPPAVTKLSLASGPLAGGTKLKITGLNFKNPDVTGVLFGKVAAKSFTVTSSSTVAAVAPAAAEAGPVDITVTTSAGTSPVVGADRFTYTAG